MCLTVTAIDEKDNSAMALRHKEYDVRGVQFHPESVLTEFGKEMMQNWLNLDNKNKGERHFERVARKSSTSIDQNLISPYGK
jgi:hypothetical protein